MEYSKYKLADESTGLLFWQVSTLWQRQIKNALKTCDLTHTQYVILTVIHHLTQEQAYVTQKSISEISKIDVMTVSKTLRLLEKRKLISRNNHPKDTRAKNIINTELGTGILEKAIPLVEEIDTNFFTNENLDKGALIESLLILREQHK